MSEQPMSEKPNENMSEQPIDDEQFEEEEGVDDNDYIPDFIQKLIDNPPLLPGESEVHFLQMFESFEFASNGRPKTDAEYILVYQATMVTWDLMRLERMKVKILTYQGRFAAENIYRKTSDNLGTEGEAKEAATPARKWAQHYFADPEFRKAYAAKLEAAGYGAGAIEAEAFLRSLHSLGQIERLVAALEKRLLNILKKLDACYASRDPEMKIPRSVAASRADKK
jgi:hypothetical protein